jgi:hypothetical protein
LDHPDKDIPEKSQIESGVAGCQESLSNGTTGELRIRKLAAGLTAVSAAAHTPVALTHRSGSDSQYEVATKTWYPKLRARL